MKNNEIMLEVFEIFGPDDMYRISLHRDLSFHGIYGRGYDIKILTKNIIVHNNHAFKKMQFFVKAKLCTLKKFKEVMKESGLYNNGKDVNVEFLMEIGMVGIIVNDEDNIPLYFCVHRDLVRQYRKNRSKKQFLKFAA